MAKQEKGWVSFRDECGCLIADIAYIYACKLPPSSPEPKTRIVLRTGGRLTVSEPYEDVLKAVLSAKV